MKDLQKKIAYLQGQVDGMKLDKSPEGQVISDVLEVLESVSDYLDYLRESQEDLEDYVESIDSDLACLLYTSKLVSFKNSNRGGKENEEISFNRFSSDVGLLISGLR